MRPARFIKQHGRRLAWQGLWGGLYVFGLCVLLTRAWEQPQYNWDLLPYVASAVAIDQTAPQDIHTRTFERLQNELPEQVWRNQFKNPGGEFGKAVAADAEVLYQLLPFYQTKPLYVWGLWFGGKLGLSMVATAQIINLLSYAALALVLALWRPDGLSLPVWLGVSFWLLWRLAVAAHLFTPDALASALCVGACFVWMEKPQRRRLALGLLVAAILARPDSLLLGAPFLVYIAFCLRTSRLEFLKAMLACAIAYTLPNLIYGSYGWAMTFEHSFIHKITRPAEHVSSFGWNDYHAIAGARLSRLFSGEGSPLLRLLLLAGIAAPVIVLKRGFGSEQMQLYAWFGIAIVLAFFAKLFVFPAPGLRFHVSVLLLGWVVVGHWIGAWLRQRNASIG